MTNFLLKKIFLFDFFFFFFKKILKSLTVKDILPPDLVADDLHK